MTDLLVDGANDAAKTIVLTHGAGGGMRTPFLAAIAKAVAGAGFRAVRFEFPYMAARKKRPDHQSVLLETWREVVRELGGGEQLIIGGKSMGGRIASMVADELHVRGLLCLGYPFHPPGDRQKLRTAHLTELRTPTLIVQGTRDPFGTRAEVETYPLSPAIHVDWIEGGDHSFRNREHLAKTIDATVRFVTAA
jgi:predicted alpha/beta-hydrolase family hydrolase